MARRRSIALEAADVSAVLAALKYYRSMLDCILEDTEGDDVQNVKDARTHIDALVSRFAAIPTT